MLQMQEINIIGSKQKSAVGLCFAPPTIKALHDTGVGKWSGILTA